MLKKIKQYFHWLFQSNVLTYNAADSVSQLVFEGKSRVFWRTLFNLTLSIVAMVLPIIFMAFDIGINSLLTPVFILLMFTGFIVFCIGILAMVYQPFWVHKNNIRFTKDQLQTISSIGWGKKQLPKKLNAFTLHYDFVQPGMVHVQFWVNRKKMHFVNAFITSFVRKRFKRCSDMKMCSNYLS